MSGLDEELRAQFAALRDVDASMRPPFRAPAPAVARGRRANARLVGWLTAAAILAAIGATLLRPHADSRMAAAPPTIPDSLLYTDISAWSSPTAGLLRSAERLPVSARPLMSSALDGIDVTAPSPPSRNGDGS